MEISSSLISGSLRLDAVCDRDRRGETLRRLRLFDQGVVTVTGKIERRSDETINRDLPTGEIELRIGEIQVESAADALPLQVAGDADFRRSQVTLSVSGLLRRGRLMPTLS